MRRAARSIKEAMALAGDYLHPRSIALLEDPALEVLADLSCSSRLLLLMTTGGGRSFGGLSLAAGVAAVVVVGSALPSLSNLNSAGK